MTPNVTRIACLQLDPVFGDVTANRNLTVTAIRDAVSAGAEVIVLPELVSSGYVFRSQQEAAAAAVATNSDLIGAWASEARRAGAVIAAGFCELGEDGRLYNSAALFDGTGLRALYRKLHLWDREKLFFTPGGELPPVIDTPFGRIGLMICYDLEFPELTRAVALAGAQLLLVPTNWPLVDRPDGERPPEVLIGMAAARVNGMAIACADRVGVERAQEWTGGSAIINSDGWVAAESRDRGMVLVDLDLGAALDKRVTDNADLFTDRRPEFYGAVTETIRA